MEKFIISIDEPSKQFQTHLEIENNNRIFFSGRFGSGKTYFLNEFFERNKDKYEVIHLYPVNYSVSSNEDIFELIKYDILFELLAKGLDLEKVEISRLMTLQFFLIENSYDLLKKFAQHASDVGKNIATIVEAVLTLKRKFDGFHKNAKVDEEKVIINYLESFKDKAGSVYEEDFHTQLIIKLIDQLKERKKQVVLIIDDLDRIDPEHIFRLLNVFAAHFDLKRGSNKFDFDKIILVGDISNIRNIFHTKYGIETDFSGYIDKFFSYEVFKFANNRIVADSAITFLLKQLKSDEKAERLFNFSNEGITPVKLILNYCLWHFAELGLINLRSLIKLNGLQYSHKTFDFIVGKDLLQNSDHYPILNIFRFLEMVFGEEKKLDTALQELKDRNICYMDVNDRKNRTKAGELIVLHVITQETFDKDTISETSGTLSIEEFYYMYSVIGETRYNHHYNIDFYRANLNLVTHKSSPDLDMEYSNFFGLLYETYKLAKRISSFAPRTK